MYLNKINSEFQLLIDFQNNELSVVLLVLEIVENDIDLIKSILLQLLLLSINPYHYYHYFNLLICTIIIIIAYLINYDNFIFH